MASDKLNGELKSGRWFEGEANEAVVYGGKLKVGDTFSVEGRKFEVVGILSLPPISGWIHKDQSEYNVMDFCRIGITNFSKGVIINAKSEYARNNLADIYDVVFNIAKFSDEELKELETYGNVIYIDEFKGNTPWLTFLPIVIAPIFAIVLWYCMKMIREKVSKILGLYFSHGVSSDEGVKLFQKYSLKDVIIGTVVGLVAAYCGTKGCVDVIIFTVGVLVPMLIAVPVIKRFMKTEFYYCCPELDSKYQREMFILGEKTVNDNIALVFVLKDNCAADRAYLKTSDYIKSFFLSAVKDTKVSDLAPFMRNRLEYAMRMARCEEKVVAMPNRWKEAPEEEIANIKAIERKVEITFNRTIEWQEC